MKENNLNLQARADRAQELIQTIDALYEELYGLTDHHLKTLPLYFDAIQRGTKRFEVRWNDRGYKQGDVISLDEWDPQSRSFTGNSFLVLVEEVFPLDDVARSLEGYVAFTFRLLSSDQEAI